MRYFSSFTGAGGLDFYIVLYYIMVIDMRTCDKCGKKTDRWVKVNTKYYQTLCEKCWIDWKLHSAVHGGTDPRHKRIRAIRRFKA